MEYSEVAVAAFQVGTRIDHIFLLPVIAMAAGIMTLVGMFPAAAEVYRHLTDFDSTGVEAWAYLLFLLTGIQLIYALYLVQLPDWSTTWVVMVVSAGVAVFYAGSMGVSLMAAPDNALLGSLGLAELNRAGYVSPWTLLMTLLTSLLTYFLIRASIKWQKSFELAMAGREG